MLKQAHLNEYILVLFDPIDIGPYQVSSLLASGHGSDGNEVVLRILQSSDITGTSPSDSLVSYPAHLLWEVTPLKRCSRCILQP